MMPMASGDHYRCYKYPALPVWRFTVERGWEHGIFTESVDVSVWAKTYRTGKYRSLDFVGWSEEHSEADRRPDRRCSPQCRK